MGVVDKGKPRRSSCPSIPISIFHSALKLPPTMKSFIVLLFIGMAIAGDDMMGHEKMKKQWADYKAMESCFGEDMMKTSMLKMKKAVVKCLEWTCPNSIFQCTNLPTELFMHYLKVLKTYNK